ncbi:hypothetical protein CHLRE_01g000750v5 [Chlamydomonas reinhardtii]|uniref:RING-type domain-containing protein n=1 Tax=Chlamydomonas reinhardtii TaxID=3055 RepID=A0A2K3E4N5_CHLRE|nr:uncharacterized protein CHLRE_01g000750v5 [Chlamydomonas reinhardtii]PNW87752.1 hypothetical protein CHLRE_01g000750v5 [Chlamydomonas reinhardtii]
MKLDGGLRRWSWWGVFSPTLAGHALLLPLNVTVLMSAHYMVFKQIGPPPPLTASPGLVLQYALLRHTRLRSHRVDWANSCLEGAALCIVKILFCNALQRGVLASTSLRLMFTPIWAVWVATVVLLCFKDRTERMFGSSRDLLFIFLLFVAFKVDNQSTYSWRVVFLVPWMWFSGLLLVAAMVLMLLLFAKAWARPRELLLPIGFVCLLVSTLPQFFSYIALVRRLDGDTGTSVASIMWPNALSWLLMWSSAGLVAAALRGKERVRDQLLARGAVWTAHEAVARRLHAERDEAQRRVDELSEEQVAALVEAMMAGKAKPGRLRRVGATLYKRVADLEPALDRAAAAQQQLQQLRSQSGAGAGARGLQQQGAGGVGGPEGGQGQGQGQGQGMAVELLRSASAMAALGRGRAGGGGGGGIGAGTAAGGEAAGGGSGDSGAGAVLLQPLGGGAGGGGGGLTGLLMMKNNRVVPLPLPASHVEPPPTASAGSGAAGSAVGLRQPLLAAGTATSSSGRGAAGDSADVESSLGGSFRIGTQVAPDDPGAGQAGPLQQEGSAAGAAAAGQAQPSGAVAGPGPRPPLPPRAPAGTSAVAAGTASTGAGAGTANGASSAAGPRGARRRPTSAPHPAASRAAAASAAAGAAAGGGHGQGLGRQVLVPGSAEWRAAVAAMQQQAAGPGAAGAGGRGGGSAGPAGGRPGGGSTSGAAGSVGSVGAGGDSLLSRLGAVMGMGGAPSLAPDLAPHTAAAALAAPHHASPASRQQPLAQPTAQVGGRSPAALEPEAGSGGSATQTGGGANEAGVSAAVAQSPRGGTTWRAEAGGAAAGQGGSGGSVAGAADTAAGGGEESAAGGPLPAAGAGTGAAGDGVLPDGAVSTSGSGGGAPGRDVAAVGTALQQDGPPDEPPPQQQGQGQQGQGQQQGGEEDDEDACCVICYDGAATCVFLECGHGGFCRRCAHLLFVRPPNECPTCRALIEQVVEIEAAAPVGAVAVVK